MTKTMSISFKLNGKSTTVDVPPDMELFGSVRAEADGARSAAQAMQVPVYAGLTREQVERVASTVRDVLGSA